MKNSAAVREDPQTVSQSLAQRFGGRLNQVFRHALNGFLVALKEADARALSADPQVAYVEEDGWVYPDAVQGGATGGLDRVDQRSLPLDGNSPYDATDSGVHAYVIDSGIRASHSRTRARSRLPGPPRPSPLAPPSRMTLAPTAPCSVTGAAIAGTGVGLRARPTAGPGRHPRPWPPSGARRPRAPPRARPRNSRACR
ncbi:protease inhibitor I9 family protein [Stigmatella aurantiaca]|nr:protease inhibitor I9 family protein [Stigmatella aurantiaca]